VRAAGGCWDLNLVLDLDALEKAPNLGGCFMCRTKIQMGSTTIDYHGKYFESKNCSQNGSYDQN